MSNNGTIQLPFLFASVGDFNLINFNIDMPIGDYDTLSIINDEKKLYKYLDIVHKEVLEFGKSKSMPESLVIGLSDNALNQFLFDLERNPDNILKFIFMSMPKQGRKHYLRINDESIYTIIGKSKDMFLLVSDEDEDGFSKIVMPKRLEFFDGFRQVENNITYPRKTPSLFSTTLQ